MPNAYRQPSEQDQIAFFRSFIRTGARWNSVMSSIILLAIPQRAGGSLQRDMLYWAMEQNITTIFFQQAKPFTKRATSFWPDFARPFITLWSETSLFPYGVAYGRAHIKLLVMQAMPLWPAVW